MNENIKYDPIAKEYVGKCRECYGLKWHPIAYLRGIHSVMHLIIKHPRQMKTKMSYTTIFIPFQSGLAIPVEKSKELRKEEYEAKALKLF